MRNCEFCRIIRGEADAEILYRNDHAISILDINPIHHGHVLIIPITHCETFIDIPESELPFVASATQIMSQAIVSALNPHGYNIFSNNGRAAGQSVFHFHFHVTPRYDDDNIKFLLKLKQYSSDEKRTYADLIRKSINHDSVPQR